MGLVSTISVVSFSLLVLCTSLTLVITKHPKPTNELASRDHVLAQTTPSNAGHLTVLEVIALVLAALAIAGLYSCIFVHEEPSQNHPIPPLATEIHNCSVTQIRDQGASDFAHPDTHTRPAQRGPSKPAVQIQCIPTYGEKLHHSPTEELACHGLGAATNGSTQGSEIRGRIDAVAQPNTTGRSFVDSSTQTVDSESQLKEATTRPPPRTRSYTRKIHTAPCFSTPDYILPPPEPENALLGSLKGFQLRPVGSAQSTSVHVLAVGLSWSHVEGKVLPGPAHDICWLKKFFADQQQVRFNSLLDREASFSKIQQSVAHIYMNAQPNDYVILYFTGHGDSRNAFELYDGPGSLDEVTLNGWIVELRQKSSKQVPVYIIFDFCRESSVRSDAQLDRDVTVVWSCPPGQKSPDLGLSNDLPYSCFLLALLLAIYDGSECHASSTVQYFAHVMDQTHGAENGGVVTHTRASYVEMKSMALTMEKLPDFPTVVRYASTRLPLPIRKVRQLLGGNQWFMYFNPSLISTDKGSSTLKERKFLPRDVHTTSESAMHARGTTMPLGAMPAAPSK